ASSALTARPAQNAACTAPLAATLAVRAAATHGDEFYVLSLPATPSGRAERLPYCHLTARRGFAYYRGVKSEVVKHRADAWWACSAGKGEGLARGLVHKARVRAFHRRSRDGASRYGWGRQGADQAQPGRPSSRAGHRHASRGPRLERLAGRAGEARSLVRPDVPELPPEGLRPRRHGRGREPLPSQR